MVTFDWSYLAWHDVTARIEMPLGTSIGVGYDAIVTVESQDSEDSGPRAAHDPWNIVGILTVVLNAHDKYLKVNYAGSHFVWYSYWGQPGNPLILNRLTCHIMLCQSNVTDLAESNKKSCESQEFCKALSFLSLFTRRDSWLHPNSTLSCVYNGTWSSRTVSCQGSEQVSFAESSVVGNLIEIDRMWFLQGNASNP